MIKGVILDIDGTLFDSMDMWMKVGGAYLRSLGITPAEDVDEFMASFSLEQGVAYLHNAYLQDKTEEEIMAGVIGIVTDFYVNRAQLKPGAFEFLSKLRAHSIPMCIATMSDRSYIEAALKRLGIFQWFTSVEVCSELRTNKHSPDVYKIAADKLLRAGETEGHFTGADYSEIWVFEDALYAARTAANAGFSVAAMYDSYAETNKTEMQKICRIYMNSWQDDDGFWYAAEG